MTVILAIVFVGFFGAIGFCLFVACILFGLIGEMQTKAEVENDPFLD